ncbi:hypothetical protein LWHH1689_1846 [Limosilactobacillus reuteri]|uniref:Uncharacterized protein n=1 Tax=Limosilactobacillus reuteri TaxID=1598 RepID=A0A2S1ET56_LIMRT|nr:hypothetical protein LWHH1689_1846 [Limosilactobacillus reuteri]
MVEVLEIGLKAVYYQSKDMAQQNADKKFADLHYQDDD